MTFTFVPSLNYFLFVLILGTLKAEYRIVFDPDFSPPLTIPADADKIYSVPLNQRISKPIYAYLEKDGERVSTAKHGNIANLPFTIESIDVNVYRKRAGVDKWKNKGGFLCQKAFNVEYPNRWNLQKAKSYCGENKSRTVLQKDLRAYNGLLIAESLYHKHLNMRIVPDSKRVFKFALVLPDHSVVVGTTNAVLVETPAWQLRFQDDFITEVKANQPFSFSLKILDINKHILRKGLDSTAFVEVRVSWEYTTHYSEKGKEMFLRTTEARLAGSETKENTRYHDTVLQKRATAGIVTFKDVRILDVHSGLRLNGTLTQARCHWIRTPEINRDYTSMKLVNRHQENEHYKYELSLPTDSPVALSKRFKVIAQLADSLVLLTPVSVIAKETGANYPIIPSIEVEVRDYLSNRIYSGPDSTLKVFVNTKPRQVCLSSDAVFNLTNGRGVFSGSICHPVNSVSLIFETFNRAGQALRTSATNNFKVTDNLFIAHYGNFYQDGTGTATGPVEKQFVKYAMDDIKNGFYQGYLQGRKLNLKSFDTKGDPLRTYDLLTDMIKQGNKKPTEKVQGIIGMGGNEITKAVRTLLAEEKIPTVAVKEDSSEFNSIDYPYFSRVCWNSEQTTKSLFRAFTARKWRSIVIVRDYKEPLPENFHSLAVFFDILIAKEILLKMLPRDKIDTTVFLRKEMDDIKKAGIKIIFYLVTRPLIFMLIRNAYRYGVSCMHGYQWVTYGKYIAEFPWQNEHELCKQEPLCTVAFKGMHGFVPGYNVSNLNTKTWIRVMNEHSLDPSSDKAAIMYPGQVAAIYGLAYDATIILVHALNEIIKEKNTFTGEQIKRKIEESTITGLTGKLRLQSNQRTGYTGFLVVVNPMPPKADTPKSQVAIYSRYIREYDDNKQQEIHLQAYSPLNVKSSFAPIAFANAKLVNKIKIFSSSGMISSDNFQLVPVPPDTLKPTESYIKETSVAPFHCEGGCGGNRIAEDDLSLYEFGNCTGLNRCVCVRQFSGDRCQKRACGCVRGYCFTGNECVCEKGWSGKFCDQAICKPACENGKCIGPGLCSCDNMWIGKDCSVLLPVAVLLPVICAALISVGLCWLLRFVAKQSIYKHAVNNLDWKINWDDIQTDKTPTNFVYVRTDEDYDHDTKTVICRHQRCYMKSFNIESLDIHDENIRRDMMFLKQLKHKNVVGFIGACIKAPHVSLFLELCPKGSLDDILCNESLKLSWECRFSILKDICKGMIGLHDSSIQSHGRLRSSNCLIDNRWTCKISGFGCPTMRHIYSKVQEAEGRQIKKSSLFWTAPELLRTAETLDEVGSGTKEGDVFSFAIIFLEVMTRDQPYSIEMTIISADEIINLLKDKNAKENQATRKALSKAGIDFGFSNTFRPSYDQTCLPSDGKIRKHLKMLISTAWTENPVKRPTFKNLLHSLKEMLPVKGGSLNNIANILEKYSCNVEDIAAEKSKQLMSAKENVDRFLQDGLPVQIATEMKCGRMIEATQFSSVSILFSDITGFTSMVKDSNPEHVITLLNGVYRIYDTVVKKYDAFRASTVADQCMVASGLPEPNGNNHVAVVSSLALDLLASMLDFKVRHMPNMLIQLRIGIHSGPVLAGIVGLKLPRYCIFGETVNTALRLQLHSKSLRVLLSNVTTDILTKVGGFHLERRPDKEVKNKINMTTYWLLGKSSKKSQHEIGKSKSQTPANSKTETRLQFATQSASRTSSKSTSKSTSRSATPSPVPTLK